MGDAFDPSRAYLKIGLVLGANAASPEQGGRDERTPCHAQTL